MPSELPEARQAATPTAPETVKTITAAVAHFIFLIRLITVLRWTSANLLKKRWRKEADCLKNQGRSSFRQRF